jgi:hypothetical protein
MRQKRLIALTLEAEVQRLRAENQRLADKCIQLGLEIATRELEIAIREEEDMFKRSLLPAAGPNLRIPLPVIPFKQG